MAELPHSSVIITQTLTYRSVNGAYTFLSLTFSFLFYVLFILIRIIQYIDIFIYIFSVRWKLIQLVFEEIDRYIESDILSVV